MTFDLWMVQNGYGNLSAQQRRQVRRELIQQNGGGDSNNTNDTMALWSAMRNGTVTPNPQRMIQEPIVAERPNEYVDDVVLNQFAMKRLGTPLVRHPYEADDGEESLNNSDFITQAWGFENGVPIYDMRAGSTDSQFDKTKYAMEVMPGHPEAIKQTLSQIQVLPMAESEDAEEEGSRLSTRRSKRSKKKGVLAKRFGGMISYLQHLDM